MLDTLQCLSKLYSGYCIWYCLQGYSNGALAVEYFKGVMSKPLSLYNAMVRYAHTTDWIFFTDSDVHINAG